MATQRLVLWLTRKNLAQIGELGLLGNDTLFELRLGVFCAAHRTLEASTFLGAVERVRGLRRERVGTVLTGAEAVVEQASGAGEDRPLTRPLSSA